MPKNQKKKHVYLEDMFSSAPIELIKLMYYNTGITLNYVELRSYNL